MKYFYQINNLEKKETKFYNSKRKLISEDKLPKNIIKVAMGFPYAIIFHPPLDGKIYAYVIDQAGRKQYFYTKEYKEQMEEKKFKNFLLIFQTPLIARPFQIKLFHFLFYRLMKTYVFGYGSLINIKYVKELKTIERTKIPVIVNNLYRHWIL